jgi:TolB-like protein
MVGMGIRVAAWLWVALLIALGGLVPAAARAQPSLAVLGFVSDEGDDQLAEAITRALRAEAAEGGAYSVGTSTASLAQMTMAQDCEISEAACRQAIGRALSTEHVIYGAVRRAGSRGHIVEAHLFDSASGEETVATRPIAAGTTGEQALAPTAREVLRALRGESEETPAAVAPAADEPASAVPTVAPDVAPLADVEGRDQEEPAPSRGHANSNDWLGYTLIGVGVASLGATVFSWIQIDQANEDVDLRAYRMAVPSTVDDACEELDRGNAHGLNANMLGNADDACSKGKTFDVLQYVFLATAVVSGGVGVYFLLDDEGEAARAGATSRRFAFTPQLGPSGGRLTARVAF